MGSIITKKHPFDIIEEGQPEIGMILSKLYAADSHPQKVNLLRGAFQAEVGKPHVPKSTMKAREMLAKDSSWDHDYIPFLGAPDYLRLGQKLMFGDQNASLDAGLIASMQTVGATGAIHMAGRFLLKHYQPWKDSAPVLYVSDDTWVNHRRIFTDLGIQVCDLPYHDLSSNTIDWKSYQNSIDTLPSDSVVVLQTAAHNPTGCDPTESQWDELIQIFLENGFVALLDSAYLGLVSGDIDVDAWVIRRFESAGIPLLLTTTFGKSFGLYGERLGMLSIIASSSETKSKIESEMALLARSETGCSPAFGAKLVERILMDDEIYQTWKEDVKSVASELQRRRQCLKDELIQLDTPGNWNFLTRQVGMFSLLNVTAQQLKFLREECHLYFDGNGRISFAALDDAGIELVAKGLDRLLNV